MKNGIIESEQTPDLGSLAPFPGDSSSSDFRPPQDYNNPEGGDLIARGGEFLDKSSAVPHDSNAVEREIIAETEQYYKEMSEISALVNHPGFKAILKKIDSMIEEERENGEYALERSLSDPKLVVDTNKLHMGLYAVTRLKRLKIWLSEQNEEYQEVLKNETSRG